MTFLPVHCCKRISLVAHSNQKHNKEENGRTPDVGISNSAIWEARQEEDQEFEAGLGYAERQETDICRK